MKISGTVCGECNAFTGIDVHLYLESIFGEIRDIRYKRQPILGVVGVLFSFEIEESEFHKIPEKYCDLYKRRTEDLAKDIIFDDFFSIWFDPEFREIEDDFYQIENRQVSKFQKDTVGVVF